MRFFSFVLILICNYYGILSGNIITIQTFGVSFKKVYNFLLKYLTKIIKEGRTHLCIVLMGLKGVGKSFFIKLVKELIGGSNYFTPIIDINRLTSNFNRCLENKILIGIEEIVSNAGEFHKVQEIIKKRNIDSHNEVELLKIFGVNTLTNPFNLYAT